MRSKQDPASKRYARALFMVAKQRGRTEEQERELKVIVEVFSRHPNVWRLLSSPDVASSEKRRLFKEIFAEIGKDSFSLLFLLLERQRLFLIEQISESFSYLVNKEQNRRIVIFTVAIKPNNEVCARLTKKIEDVLGCKVLLKVEIDPRIIGGGVLAIGDKRIDGSIASDLERMKRFMVYSNRSGSVRKDNKKFH
ncbi:MAG: ATP synthase F1 subunit delta [bacterium]|nr:ATP synthase F1 subunit delta [bacterium]